MQKILIHNIAQNAEMPETLSEEELSSEEILEETSEEVQKTIQKHTKIQEENKSNSKHRFWLILMLIAVIIFSLRLIIVPVAVVGESMMPTYKNGTLLVTLNASLKDEISYGSVVVFRNASTKNSMYIKRVEGLPGDIIQVKGGILFRNGEKITENYDYMQESGMYEEEMTLKENEYFVLGDNRNHSTDSRFIGPVMKDEILYVAVSK